MTFAPEELDREAVELEGMTFDPAEVDDDDFAPSARTSAGSWRTLVRGVLLVVGAVAGMVSFGLTAWALCSKGGICL